jgi:membrane-anchored mycosin MYCP
MGSRGTREEGTRMTVVLVRRLLSATLLGVFLVAVPFAAPASAATCVDPGQPVRAVPWAQQMLDPSRAWSYTKGAGVTVAVLDSGVDPAAGADGAHKQLAGRVDAGSDATATGAANNDCTGTGTGVAGVVAAAPVEGFGFAGVAPAARILPVRVSNNRGFGGSDVTGAVLAKAIRYAVDNHATVIDVAVPVYISDPQLQTAVQYAAGKDVLVIAAVGDNGAATNGNPTPYPAVYPGVLGVGAINEGGEHIEASQYGAYVDLVAPGDNIVTLQRGSGFVPVTGTGVASGFVAGAAALIRSANPGLKADDVAQRLLATATPAAGTLPETGHGIVNPAAAVSDQMANGDPHKLAPVDAPPPVNAESTQHRNWALIGTGIAFGAALIVAACAAAIPRGRRRRGRAGEPLPPRVRDEPDEPGPPVLLFDPDSMPTGRP